MSDLIERLRKYAKTWLHVSCGNKKIHGVNGIWITTDDLTEAADRIATLEVKLTVAREALKSADAQIGWEMEDKTVRAGLQKAIKEIGND